MRERLWMLSTWILIKYLTLFPTVFSQRNHLPVTWTGVQMFWVKNGLDSQAQSVIVNGVQSSWWVVTSKPVLGLDCLFLSTPLLRGYSALSVSLWVIPTQAELLICLRVGRFCRGICIDLARSVDQVQLYDIQQC